MMKIKSTLKYDIIFFLFTVVIGFITTACVVFTFVHILRPDLVPWYQLLTILLLSGTAFYIIIFKLTLVKN